MARLDRTIPSHVKAAMNKAKEEERAQKFLILLSRADIRPPLREEKVHPTRAYRVDFVWLPIAIENPTGWSRGVILEAEGGIQSGGRHGRAKGVIGDLDRSNELQLIGYTVLRVPSDKLPTSATVNMVRRALLLPRTTTLPRFP